MLAKQDVLEVEKRDVAAVDVRRCGSGEDAEDTRQHGSYKASILFQRVVKWRYLRIAEVGEIALRDINEKRGGNQPGGWHLCGGPLAGEANRFFELVPFGDNSSTSTVEVV